jgi:hypothetical protein
MEYIDFVVRAPELKIKQHFSLKLVLEWCCVPVEVIFLE